MTASSPPAQHPRQHTPFRCPVRQLQFCLLLRSPCPPLVLLAGVYPCSGRAGVKTPSLSLQPVRGRRKQRQPELKCSQPDSWQEAGLFCSLCEVRRRRLGGRRQRRGVTSAPSFLCTSYRAPPLLPDKEVTLGSSFYNWREGYRIMTRQDSPLAPEASVCPSCSSLCQQLLGEGQRLWD